MTRGNIKAIIVKNLENAGSVFYNDTELNDSIQDAYDDIAILTQFLVKSATIAQAAKNYYNFKDDHAVSDYLSTIAIFNSATNFWLRDDLAYRQFDKLRRDWENMRGNSAFWAPLAFNRIAVVPFNATPVGNFVLKYAATAPTLANDASVFLIAGDMINLVEFYVTADMLETAEEYAKASRFWSKYYTDVEVYKQRCHNLAAADLMLRV